MKLTHLENKFGNWKTLLITLIFMLQTNFDSIDAQELTSECTNKNDQIKVGFVPIEIPKEVSFRGLSVVDANTFWVSGAEGTILRSTDGGKTVQDVSIADAPEVDFRDIHAFNAKTAVAMGVASPGLIYRTIDGGENWTKVFEDNRENFFLDAMDFWNDKEGIAFGDAIDGRLLILRTSDGGNSWSELDRKLQPVIDEGEGGFAASGTCLITVGEKTVWIGSGSHVEGKSSEYSRAFISHDRGQTWSTVRIPMPRNQSSGIFSVCQANNNHILAVGGDYQKPDQIAGNLAISTDSGKTWSVPESKNPPNGFRSVVIACPIDDKKVLFAAGTSGCDVSFDNGINWQAFGNENINVLIPSPDGKVIYAAGRGTVFRCKTAGIMSK